MPKRPADDLSLPPDDPVDPDHIDPLDEDLLPDDLDLQDLEAVFTEEAPVPIVDDEDEPDLALPELPEDALLGHDAPLEAFDDADDDALALDESTAFEAEIDWDALTGDGPAALPILDWEQQVSVPELGRDLPAVLDPTEARTTWLRPGSAAPQTRLTIALGGDRIEVHPTLRDSATESLRIGRDVLAGRFLVRS